MTTRAITGTIKKPDGTVYTDAAVVFKLKDDIISSGVVVPKHDVDITTDALGAFSVTLYVPDSGTCTYELVLDSGYSQEFEFGSGAAVTLADIFVWTTVAEDPNSVSQLTTLNVVSKTATYAILATDEIIRCDGTFTVTLPAATGSNAMYMIINHGTGTITVAVTGADTINGTTHLTIPANTNAWYLDGEAGNWDSNW